MRRITAPEQRGFTLVECMVALLILSFGLLGAAALQATMHKASSKVDSRLRAVNLATELHAMMLADYNNLSCYTYPGGTCSNATTTQAMSDWVTEVKLLPGGLDPVVAQAGGVWTITLQWTMPQDNVVNQYSIPFKVDGST